MRLFLISFMVLKDKVVRLSSSNVTWLQNIDLDIDAAITKLRESDKIEVVSHVVIKSETLHKMFAGMSGEILNRIDERTKDLAGHIKGKPI